MQASESFVQNIKHFSSIEHRGVSQRVQLSLGDIERVDVFQLTPCDFCEHVAELDGAIVDQHAQLSRGDVGQLTPCNFSEHVADDGIIVLPGRVVIGQRPNVRAGNHGAARGVQPRTPYRGNHARGAEAQRCRCHSHEKRQHACSSCVPSSTFPRTPWSVAPVAWRGILPRWPPRGPP
eukprot:scaffold4414_cov135-Isochrysis_galbana.AAC.9